MKTMKWSPTSSYQGSLSPFINYSRKHKAFGSKIQEYFLLTAITVAIVNILCQFSKPQFQKSDEKKVRWFPHMQSRWCVSLYRREILRLGNLSLIERFLEKLPILPYGEKIIFIKLERKDIYTEEREASLFSLSWNVTNLGRGWWRFISLTEECRRHCH